jgi:hypothetical protein
MQADTSKTEKMSENRVQELTTTKGVTSVWWEEKEMGKK